MKTVRFLLCILFFSLVHVTFGQWVQLNSNTANSLNEIYFASEDTGYVVGELGTILKTADGGSTWSLLNSGTTANLHSVYFTDVNVGYAVGDYGIGDSALILKTNNGGQTWNIQYSDTTMQGPKQIRDIQFINDSVGFAGGRSEPSTSLILKTINRGITWNIINVPLTTGGNALINSLHFPSQDTGFALTYNSPVLKTVDQGNTWVHISNSGMGSIVNEDIFFINSQLGFSVGWYAPGIAKTLDGGVTWNSVTPQTLDGFYSVHFIGEDTGYVVGRGGIIYNTIDGGNNWFGQNSSTISSLNSIFCTNNSTCYAVGYGGTIIKTINSGVEITEMKNMDLVSVFPNPTNGNLNIQNNLSGPFEFQLYNNLGERILSNLSSSKTSLVSLNSFPTGIYFYMIILEKDKFISGYVVKQ